MAFRTRACISPVTSVFLEKQSLWKLRGAQWLRDGGGNELVSQIAEVSSRQPPGCSVLHPPWLEGPFSHVTSNPAGTAFCTCGESGRAGIPLDLNDGDTDNSAGA